MKQDQSEIQKYSQQLKKHQVFLSKFNIFPEKTRKVIYCSLMNLPLNHHHFLQLTKPFKKIPQHTLNNQVAFITNALSKLYPSLNNQWLPGIIYPFVKLFQQDSIMCFQSSLTFLINWYQPVYQSYPNPSKKIMEFASKHLSKLQSKVNQFSYPLSAVVNPMLLVCLTDVLNKQDSLQLLDFLIAHPFSPQYFICSAISIMKMVQEKLITLDSIESIILFLKKEKNLKVREIIQKTIDLAKQSQKQLEKIFKNIVFPLPKLRYPFYQFTHVDEAVLNEPLQQVRSNQIGRLQQKYNVLSRILNSKLQNGDVINQYEIQNKYDQVQSQMVAYLKKTKQEHQIKLNALSDIQHKFKQKINLDLRHQKHQKNLDLIQRRGKLQRQILQLEQEANKIRTLQQNLIKRMKAVEQIKKNQLLQQNKMLKKQQRRQKLFP